MGCYLISSLESVWFWYSLVLIWFYSRLVRTRRCDRDHRLWPHVHEHKLGFVLLIFFSGQRYRCDIFPIYCMCLHYPRVTSRIPTDSSADRTANAYTCSSMISCIFAVLLAPSITGTQAHLWQAYTAGRPLLPLYRQGPFIEKKNTHK